jgi:molybdopterin converting factor small subunit
MEVTVNLMSTFARYMKNGNSKITIKKGSTIRDLARQLRLPEKYVRIITVNGKQVDLDKMLSAGDIVFIFPPAIGGG